MRSRRESRRSCISLTMSSRRPVNDDSRKSRGDGVVGERSSEFIGPLCLFAFPASTRKRKFLKNMCNSIELFASPGQAGISD